MNLKRMTSWLTALALAVGLCGGLSVPARAVASRTVANVVVFVDFADTTTHDHIDSTWGHCFKTEEGAKETFEMFDGDAAHPTGMGKYLDTISYGQFAVENIFPQYDAITKKITPYTLQHNMEYYAGADAIINELLTETAHSNQLSTALSGKALDRDGDGNVDNLTIVVPCENGNSNQKFNSLQGTFSWGGESGSERPKLAGKEVACYNLLTESSVYLSAGGSGTVIHEFLHTLGYPDLYAPSGTARPVGNWCIMSSVSRYTQYPLAYLRSQYTKWFDIPTVTESTQGYTLRAPTTTNMDTRNKQAVILRTGLSSSEFFVLEYRKLGATMNDHDHGIHGSGLFIYRVNTNSATNRDNTQPYMVYVFRPGDDYAADGREACGGKLEESFLSSESRRTGYGSANLDATLKDNAITYSDGSNSGIVISNVGSASGDTITFDITFTPLPEDAYWRGEASTQRASNLSAADSCMTADGSVYYLQTQFSGGTVLQKYDGTSWTSYSAPLVDSGFVYEVHLFTYKDELYAGYMTGSQAKISKWNGTAWGSVYTAPNAANDMDICAGQDGIYMAYLSGDNKTLYGFRYNTTSGFTSLGSWVGQGDGLANPSIAVEDGRVCVLYQDRNRRYVRTYDAGANSWKDLLSETCTTSGGMLRFDNGSLYMLKNEAGGSYLCRYEQDGSWKQLGDAYATCSVSDFDLVFMGESPCVLYFDGSAGQLKGTQLLDGAWVPMGGYISNGETVTGPRLHTDGTELYAAYFTNTSEQILLKAYTPKEAHQHNYQAEVLRDATCGAEGLRRYTCSICNHTYTEAIPKLGTHSYGGWSQVSAPTCTQSGSEKRTCSVCGGSETRAIAPKGHSWNAAATVDTPAAYSHPGSQSIHCKNCDATKDQTAIPAKKNPFEDVKPGEYSYYYTPVLWALDHGVTTGKTETIFDPFDVCTRSQVVTFLWRAAGCPEPSNAKSPFTDVQDPKEFYYKAVLWAAENDITNGMEPTLFAPNRTVTRGQFVTFLWRLAGKPASGGENPFADIQPGPFSYYYEAVLWASGCGVTNGMGDGTFAPDNTCLRGQTVTFLHRYYTEVAD